MKHNIRAYVLPFAITMGFIFHGFFANLAWLNIYLVFATLFFTTCGMDFREIRITKLHLILAAFQLVVGVAFYLALRPFNEVVAQGAMIGMFAPVAVSSAAVTMILGGSVATMVSYILFYNLVLAVVAPLIFATVHTDGTLPFWTSFWIIIRKVFPIIVFPMITAYLFQKVIPKVTAVINRWKMLPLYLWALTLTIVIGQTIDYIIVQDSSKIGEILILTAISASECFIQFGFGRWIGGRLGESIAGGQACGQKNGVISIWMAQSYLDPLSSVVPAVYTIFQNLWNSFQMIMVDKKK